MMLVAVACGGGGSATPVPATTGGQITNPPVVGGDTIDSSGIEAAVNALQSQESRQFSVDAISAGSEQTVTGTERGSPDTAVEASHSQPGGGAPFQYIRINDDIWYDVGTGQFTQVSADEAQNLIVQYEPYYLSGLADSVEVQGYEWDFVDNQTISGVPSAHYLLSEADRENITQSLDMEPGDFAGDVFIAKEGGYLMQLTWGPQTTENPVVTTGFDYLVTAVNCECPIEPPTTSPGGSGTDPY